MNATVVALVVAVNCLTILSALIVALRNGRKWLYNRLLNMVSEPLSTIQESLDTLKDTVTTVQKEVDLQRQEIDRAHQRLDRHLERHNA